MECRRPVPKEIPGDAPFHGRWAREAEGEGGRGTLPKGNDGFYLLTRHLSED